MICLQFARYMVNGLHLQGISSLSENTKVGLVNLQMDENVEYFLGSCSGPSTTIFGIPGVPTPTTPVLKLTLHVGRGLV